jgi:hypothetical protein
MLVVAIIGGVVVRNMVGFIVEDWPVGRGD